MYTRQAIADHIIKRLNEEKSRLKQQWEDNSKIHFCYIDNVLPEEMALKMYNSFPDTHTMRLNKSLRELKYVGAQMNQFDPLLEEAVYSFQDPRILKIIEEITQLKSLEPDTLLYAGGISMMEKDHFLNPHLDNSHDKLRQKYRVLNLLFYVSPHWKLENGGNLELWPQGPKKKQITIESKFNRLAIMITNKNSWHSVSKITVPEKRCCISNYYFSDFPAESDDYFHVTSFRGRPEQKIRNFVLTADAFLRMMIRKIFPKGIKETKHFYKKD